ncbi:MAG: sarcosine oxidase subunit gamma [Alphaproteobacteria bacterium]|nr:sarcosine oxidase subunit gamma [Alphaproteobacteria bacterium]
MAEPALTARTPLDGYARAFGGVALAEAAGLSLVSAAVPNGGDDAFAAALVEGFGASRPSTGESVSGDRFGGARILGMQLDQVFILFEAPDPDRAAETASAALGPAAYVTDQSDSWAMLRIEGVGVRAALERICMLDLDDAAFPEGSVARTVMEHLAVIVLRDGADSFLLMTPRSSARSFLHAVELSVANVSE